MQRVRTLVSITVHNLILWFVYQYLTTRVHIFFCSARSLEPIFAGVIELFMNIVTAYPEVRIYKFSYSAQCVCAPSTLIQAMEFMPHGKSVAGHKNSSCGRYVSLSRSAIPTKLNKSCNSHVILKAVRLPHVNTPHSSRYHRHGHRTCHCYRGL